MKADLLAEVCKDVSVKPLLNPLSGEILSFWISNVSAEARLDVSAWGVWTKNQRAFFDIRVFNLNTQKFSGHFAPPSHIAVFICTFAHIFGMHFWRSLLAHTFSAVLRGLFASTLCTIAVYHVDLKLFGLRHVRGMNGIIDVLGKCGLWWRLALWLSI